MIRFPVGTLIEKWESSKKFNRQLTTKVESRPLPGKYSPFPSTMSPIIGDWLRGKGIEKLYSHQSEAWEAAERGESVCLSTPTASGKSLCYHLPVLEGLIRRPHSRALYIFPTKALAQDQYTSFHEMISEMDLPVATHTFDGDTPQQARQAIRSKGQVVITNPDMLHGGILPHHTKWLKLFENLETVVIDEIHAYRGVFGSHLCNIIRRLKRIAAFHGSHPRFVLCSATIANPSEYAELLCEEDITLIDENGAPAGKRTFFFYNPPILNKELGIRASYIKTAKRLTLDLFQHGISTIAFAMSRLNVEILLKYIREDAIKVKRNPDEIQGYRGGYLPLHRRRIESGLRTGSVGVVVATNALELGIDIGQLDACVIAGYPGSIASLWQQSGRAGRNSKDSLTVFVARSNPLDQFIAQHPEYFFSTSPEHARINGDNLYILAEHVKCAAFELPFGAREVFGPLSEEDTKAILDHLVSHSVLHESQGQYHWMSRAYPASDVNIRNIPGENFVVVDSETGAILAEVDYQSTQTTLHENAIYNLDSDQYQVESLDWENHKAYVKRVVVDFFTDAMTYNKVTVLSHESTDAWKMLQIGHGEVSLVEKVVGFKKVRFHTGENVGYGDVALPELTMHTSAYWFTIPHALLDALELDEAEIVDGLLGISHALYYVSIMALMCDGSDLGRCVGDKSSQWFSPIHGHQPPPRFAGQVSDLHELRNPKEPHKIFDPTLFIYDAFPGGVGFSEKLFMEHETLMKDTRQMIRCCSCEQGCPSCIGALPAMNDRSKAIPLLILDSILGSSDSLRTPFKVIEEPSVPISLMNDHQQEYMDR